MNFYVSATAKTNGNGTRENPFGSIENARDYIRKEKIKNATVFLLGGRYFIKNTVRFTADDLPTVYKATEGEKVIFDGGIILDGSKAQKLTDAEKQRIIEQNQSDKIYSLDLKEYKIDLAPYGVRGFRRMHIPSANELFINEKPQKVSEYPKGRNYIKLNNIIEQGNDLITDRNYNLVKPIIGFTTERGDKWAQAKDAYISGFLSNAYADDTIGIEKIDTSAHTITLETCSKFKIESGEETRWKIINLLEEISEPGEYYIDRANQKLYFYPENEVDLSTATMQLSVLNSPMLSFIEASGIKFEGITFENSRGMGVYIGGGENINIDNCTFRNLGEIAVQIGQGTTVIPDEKTTGHGEYEDGYEPSPAHEMIGDWHGYIYKNAAWDGNGGKNHLISNCKMYDLASGGVLLGGGNRKKLIPANNTVHNCYFTRVNRLDKTYKGAVNIWGVGNHVSHCEMHDLDGFGIYLHGNDHVIEYNKIYDVIKSISDGAAIYMGRDPSEVGNSIRYNFIYNINNPHSYDMYGYAAIYFDDGAIYNEVYGNYFYNITQRGPFFFSVIHWNGGGGTSVANNIVIDCYPGLDPNTYDNQYDKMHTNPLYMRRVYTKDENNLTGVDVTSEIWRKKYPYLADTYENDYIENTKYYNNFVCSGQYHNFVEERPYSLNFKLKKDSYMFYKFTKIKDRVRNLNGEKVYFEDIDFYNIGLIKNK